MHTHPIEAPRRLAAWGAAALMLCAAVAASSAQARADDAPAPLVDLATVAWVHGAEDCDAARSAPGWTEWQQVQYLPDTWVFRQDKCADYEGPFVYLFVGAQRALLLDTGATVSGGGPLLRAVRALTDKPLIVAHTHGHGDHRQGDGAFADAPQVDLVGTGAAAVQTYFGFEDWPRRGTTLDLGERTLELLPIPGHSDDDVAFYDPRSRLLVSGDTLYPGRLYVRDWAQYRASTARLAAFAAARPVARVLGTHIEMTRTPDVDYPIRTTWQPDEPPLPLTPLDIDRLADAVAGLPAPERTYLGNFIIWPVD